MATLKQISDQIADALNRPFDDMFKERVKSVFKQELANYIRQQINKHGIDTHFKTRYSTVCKAVNFSDSSLDSSVVDRKTFRTVNKVAKPVRYITDDPFTYVGNINGKVPYKFINIAAYDFEKLLPMQQKTTDLEPVLTEIPEDTGSNYYIDDESVDVMTYEDITIRTELSETSYSIYSNMYSLETNPLFTTELVSTVVTYPSENQTRTVNTYKVKFVKTPDVGEYEFTLNSNTSTTTFSPPFPPEVIEVNGTHDKTVTVLSKYVDPETLVNRPTKYDYRNGYIYIYFNTAISSEEEVEIMIEGVHNTYDFIADESKDAKDKDLVYLDEVEFPMPDDIIQLIKDKLLAGEFSIIDNKDKIESRHIDNN